MPNLLDYLVWRGDLPMKDFPVNDADSLVFSRLAYERFENVVGDSFEEPGVLLPEAARRLLRLASLGEGAKRLPLPEDTQLLQLLSQSERFANVRLLGYVSHYDAAAEVQFSALTALLPDKTIYVLYRGTDYTLVGWKEDFNMCFETSVPAQREALQYLNAAAAHLRGKIRIGGHSKGGNLAVYAAAFCGRAVQNRILSVQSNDGPGFNEKVIGAEGFQRILARTKTYVPQSSVVGIMLEHEEDFAVIHSEGSGLIHQHNLYSWEVRRTELVPVGALTNSTQFLDTALKDWVISMTPEQREKFIDGVFSLIKATDAETLQDLFRGRSAWPILKAVVKEDDTRHLLLEGLRLFRASAHKSLLALYAERSGDRPEKEKGILPKTGMSSI